MSGYVIFENYDYRNVITKNIYNFNKSDFGIIFHILII